LEAVFSLQSSPKYFKEDVGELNGAESEEDRIVTNTKQY
jgi:hypothetical protein